MIRIASKNCKYLQVAKYITHASFLACGKSIIRGPLKLNPRRLGAVGQYMMSQPRVGASPARDPSTSSGRTDNLFREHSQGVRCGCMGLLPRQHTLQDSLLHRGVVPNELKGVDFNAATARCPAAAL